MNKDQSFVDFEMKQTAVVAATAVVEQQICSKKQNFALGMLETHSKYELLGTDRLTASLVGRKQE